MMDFEENYLGIMQNMEFVIIQIYRSHADLTDFLVDKAIEALLRFYQAEKRGKAAPALKLGGLDEQIYEAVQSVCEFHLQRPSTFKPDMELLEEVEAEVTLDVIIEGLKSLRKSISLYTKEGGRQGYLIFANQFQP